MHTVLFLAEFPKLSNVATVRQERHSEEPIIKNLFISMKNTFISYQEESDFDNQHLITYASYKRLLSNDIALSKGWVLATVGSYTYARK